MDTLLPFLESLGPHDLLRVTTILLEKCVSSITNTILLPSSITITQDDTEVLETLQDSLTRLETAVRLTLARARTPPAQAAGMRPPKGIGGGSQRKDPLDQHRRQRQMGEEVHVLSAKIMWRSKPTPEVKEQQKGTDSAASKKERMVVSCNDFPTGRIPSTTPPKPLEGSPPGVVMGTLHPYEPPRTQEGPHPKGLQSYTPKPFTARGDFEPDVIPQQEYAWLRCMFPNT